MKQWIFQCISAIRFYVGLHRFDIYFLLFARIRCWIKCFRCKTVGIDFIQCLSHYAAIQIIHSCWEVHFCWRLWWWWRSLQFYFIWNCRSLVASGWGWCRSTTTATTSTAVSGFTVASAVVSWFRCWFLVFAIWVRWPWFTFVMMAFTFTPRWWFIAWRRIWPRTSSRRFMRVLWRTISMLTAAWWWFRTRTSSWRFWFTRWDWRWWRRMTPWSRHFPYCNCTVGKRTIHVCFLF